MGDRRAAVWTVATTLVGALCQLLQLSIAARYLDAGQFGVLALVNVVMAVIAGFQDMGLSSFAVHLGEVERRMNATLFWISSALGAAGALLIAGLAYPVANFYGAPQLVPLLLLVSINLVLLGLSGQYQAHYVRVFQAKKLAQIELVARLSAFGVTLTLLAAFGWGVVSIIWGMLAFSTIKLGLMAVKAPHNWHPCFAFDTGLAPRALRYGMYQALSQLITQLRTQADQLILGKALGIEALGVYSIAKELIGYPLRVVQPLIARLTLPVLAKLQNDATALKAAVVRNIGRVALISSTIYGLLAVLAPWVVEVLYGASYLQVAALLPLMALFGAMRPLGLSIGVLAQAIGKTKNEFRWNLIVSVVVVIPNLILAVVAPGLTSFAITLSLVQLCVTLMAYPFFMRDLLPVGMAHYVRSWVIPISMVAVVSVVAGKGWLDLPRIEVLHRAAASVLGSTFDSARQDHQAWSK